MKARNPSSRSHVLFFTRYLFDHVDFFTTRGLLIIVGYENEEIKFHLIYSKVSLIGT